MKNLDPFTAYFKVRRKFELIKTQLLYKPFFGKIGRGSIIEKTTQITNVSKISIAENCIICKFGWLMPVDRGRIIIENSTAIGHYCHITAIKRVKIGKNVLIADNVFISDFNHNYTDIIRPVRNQGIKLKAMVNIGDNSWIGENAVIIGATIGRNCIIGANSVVIENVPDFTVVAGNPAKIIKKFDLIQKKWIKVI